jgi:hypothetical protein
MRIHQRIQPRVSLVTRFRESSQRAFQAAVLFVLLGRIQSRDRQHQRIVAFRHRRELVAPLADF